MSGLTNAGHHSTSVMSLKEITWNSSILSIFSTSSINDFGHGRLFSKFPRSPAVFSFSRVLVNSSFCDGSLFSFVFLSLPPTSQLRCRFGCPLSLFRFTSKLRAFSEIWWSTETPSRLQSLRRIVCRWNSFAIVKREGFLTKRVIMVSAQIHWILFCRRAQPNRQLTKTGNGAFHFLGKWVFSEKNIDAMKSFWNYVFLRRKQYRHRQRQRPYICNP